MLDKNKNKNKTMKRVYCLNIFYILVVPRSNGGFLFLGERVDHNNNKMFIDEMEFYFYVFILFGCFYPVEER